MLFSPPNEFGKGFFFKILSFTCLAHAGVLVLLFALETWRGVTSHVFSLKHTGRVSMLGTSRALKAGVAPGGGSPGNAQTAAPQAELPASPQPVSAPTPAAEKKEPVPRKKEAEKKEPSKKTVAQKVSPQKELPQKVKSQKSEKKATQEKKQSLKKEIPVFKKNEKKQDKKKSVVQESVKKEKEIKAQKSDQETIKKEQVKQEHKSAVELHESESISRVGQTLGAATFSDTKEVAASDLQEGFTEGAWSSDGVIVEFARHFTLPPGFDDIESFMVTFDISKGKVVNISPHTKGSLVVYTAVKDALLKADMPRKQGKNIMLTIT